MALTEDEERTKHNECSRAHYANNSESILAKRKDKRAAERAAKLEKAGKDAERKRRERAQKKAQEAAAAAMSTTASNNTNNKNAMVAFDAGDRSMVSTTSLGGGLLVRDESREEAEHRREMEKAEARAEQQRKLLRDKSKLRTHALDKYSSNMEKYSEFMGRALQSIEDDYAPEQQRLALVAPTTPGQPVRRNPEHGSKTAPALERKKANGLLQATEDTESPTQPFSPQSQFPPEIADFKPVATPFTPKVSRKSDDGNDGLTNYESGSKLDDDSVSKSSDDGVSSKSGDGSSVESEDASDDDEEFHSPASGASGIGGDYGGNGDDDSQAGVDDNVKGASDNGGDNLAPPAVSNPPRTPTSMASQLVGGAYVAVRSVAALPLKGIRYAVGSKSPAATQPKAPSPTHANDDGAEEEKAELDEPQQGTPVASPIGNMEDAQVEPVYDDKAKPTPRRSSRKPAKKPLFASAPTETSESKKTPAKKAPKTPAKKVTFVEKLVATVSPTKKSPKYTPAKKEEMRARARVTVNASFPRETREQLMKLSNEALKEMIVESETGWGQLRRNAKKELLVDHLLKQRDAAEKASKEQEVAEVYEA